MKVLVAGSHGLVGSALLRRFERRGDAVSRLVRSPTAVRAPEIFWDPSTGVLEPAVLEGFDAVIHLGGENLAAGRWTRRRKARIRDSRVRTTELLADTQAKLEHPPKVFLCASAIGIYGNRADEWLTEESAPGRGFLASVCREWEAAAKRAHRVGVRVVHLRFGVILSREGGALKKMLTPFRLGLGAVIGRGDQYWSWIALEDVIRAVEHVLAKEHLEGPVNFSSPEPVTNREFTQTLARVLHRPAFLRVPRLAAHLAFGEMADDALLASQRVKPQKLLCDGYAFLYPRLEEALKNVLALPVQP